MLTRTLLMMAAASGLAACSTYSSAPPYGAPYGEPAYPPAYQPPIYSPAAGPVVVGSADKAPFGTYLVDGAGRALYILEGQRNQMGMERCVGQCLAVWPPLHTVGRPGATGAAVAAQLGIMAMHGASHVTYAGWPLYYYNRDRSPGDTTGQHVTDRSGTWHLLSPSGEPIRPIGR